jgi:hypothetical protein
MSKITQDMVKTYTYDGSDDMINLDSEDIPKVHKKFKATLKLKDGRTVPAPREWREMIWKWWYNSRYDELVRQSNHAFIDMATSLLAPGSGHIEYHD